VTRRALAARLAKLAGLTVDQAVRFLGAVPTVLAAELAASGKLHWRGLGSFAVRTYPPRKIHNPATGKTIELPGRTAVAFKSSPRLRPAPKKPSASPAPRKRARVEKPRVR
jgi:nucleoid DNA-binding protein